MSVLVFIIFYLATGLPLVLWRKMDGSLASLFAAAVGFAAGLLYGRIGSRREASRIRTNRNYLFDLHIQSCKVFLKIVERTGPADLAEVRINMAMVHHKLRDALRLGIAELTDDQMAEHRGVERRFLALERKHGLDFRDYAI